MTFLRQHVDLYLNDILREIFNNRGLIFRSFGAVALMIPLRDAIRSGVICLSRPKDNFRPLPGRTWGVGDD